MKLVPSIGFREITGDTRCQLCFNYCLYFCSCFNLYFSKQPTLCHDTGLCNCWGLDGNYSCYFTYYWKGVERINDSQNGCYGCSLYSLVCCCHGSASCVRFMFCNSYTDDYIREHTVIVNSWQPKRKKSKREELMETGIRIPYTRIK